VIKSFCLDVAADGSFGVGNRRRREVDVELIRRRKWNNGTLLCDLGDTTVTTLHLNPGFMKGRCEGRNACGRRFVWGDFACEDIWC